METSGRPSGPSFMMMPVALVPIEQSTSTYTTGPPSGYFSCSSSMVMVAARVS